MKIKEFLKPDWRKIVIFVIIIIFSLMDISYYTKYGKSITVIDGFCALYEEGEPECEYSLNPLFWIIPRIEISGKTYLFFYDILINTYFIQLVYWYLLSCLIIWIYDKRKKT